MFKIKVSQVNGIFTLELGFEEGVKAPASELVKFVKYELPKYIERHEMRGQLLKINGPHPIAMAYTISPKISNLFSTIAVFVPAENAYVVANSKSAEYEVGDLIANDDGNAIII